MSENEVLETKVMAIITEHGPIRFGGICDKMGVSTSDGKRYRPVDRTIQRLRKQGKIEFVKGRWSRTVEKVAVPSEPIDYRTAGF